VTHLVDVRAVPHSAYWEAFRKSELERRMAETEIKYIWMGDTLGGPRDAPFLCKDPSAVDLTPLLAEERFQLGLAKLMKAADDPARNILLMCGCLRPHKCHRSRLIGEALAGLGVEVLHLDENGIPVPHETVVEESQPSQASLF
jgi:hypothetical protein